MKNHAYSNEGYVPDYIYEGCLMGELHAYSYEGCLIGKVHVYSYVKGPCLYLWRLSDGKGLSLFL